jgi:hypothetical protein
MNGESNFTRPQPGPQLGPQPGPQPGPQLGPQVCACILIEYLPIELLRTIESFRIDPLRRALYTYIEQDEESILLSDNNNGERFIKRFQWYMKYNPQFIKKELTRGNECFIKAVENGYVEILNILYNAEKLLDARPAGRSPEEEYKVDRLVNTAAELQTQRHMRANPHLHQISQINLNTYTPIMTWNVNGYTPLVRWYSRGLMNFIRIRNFEIRYFRDDSREALFKMAIKVEEFDVLKWLVKHYPDNIPPEDQETINQIDEVPPHI